MVLLLTLTFSPHISTRTLPRRLKHNWAKHIFFYGHRVQLTHQTLPLSGLPEESQPEMLGLMDKVPKEAGLQLHLSLAFLKFLCNTSNK